MTASAAAKHAAITVVQAPARISHAKGATIRWRVTTAGKTLCKLDGARQHGCKSPLRVKHLSRGQHTLRITAADATPTVTSVVAWNVAAAASDARTAVSAPVVTTGVATFTSASAARLSATVNPAGLATSAHFEFTKTQTTFNHVTPTRALGAGTTDVTLTDSITALVPGSTWYYRVVATNPSGTTTGATRSLTVPSAPALGVPAATTNQNAATIWFATNPYGATTTAYVEYGPTSSYGSQVQSSLNGSGTTIINSTARLTGLTASTTLHYRVVAQNSVGTIASADQTFSTTAAPVLLAPLATTGNATLTSATAASLVASVNPSSQATTGYFEFGTTSAFGHVTPTRALGSGSASVALSDSITGLTPGSTYSYRVVAINATGTTTGQTLTVAVPASVPVVVAPLAQTGTATSGANGWSIAGSADPKNGTTIVHAEYGTTTGYGTQSTTTTLASGSGTAAVSFPLAALAPSTTYHVRIVAQNSAGTTNGADASFTTAAAPVAPVGSYVSTTGSDAADGSFANPWLTLQHAANVVAPGTTVYVRGGSYAGFTMTRSGTPGSPITFAGYTGETAVLTPASGTNVVDVNNAHDIVVSNLTIQNAVGVYNAGVMIRNGSANVTVTGSTLQNNHSFGIRMYNATAGTFTNNLITHNDTGIMINFLGEGTVIAGNQINDNDGMVVNDATPGNDNGANAIQFVKSTGHISVTGNTIHGNRAPSHDYGWDGGAFEIFAASNVTMDGNTLWDNQNVMETGTDGNHTPCANNVFTHNIAYGGNDKSQVSAQGPVANGLLIRCASNMLVANNTLTDLDFWTYDISQSSSFSGGIDNLKIVNNINLQHADKIYAIETALPASDVIDNNVDYNEGGGTLALVSGHGNTSLISDLRAWAGVDVHGLLVDPQVVSEIGRDFHLGSTSPALAMGQPVAGVTSGSAPNAGRY